jgi:hypothetical protein
MDGIFAIGFEETNNQLIYIIAVSFIGGENWSYRLNTDKFYHMENIASDIHKLCV